MTSDQLTAILTKFGAVRCGSYYRSRCPLCQPDEDCIEKWRLHLSPGQCFPVVLYCHKCGEKGNRDRNREVSREACNAAGVDPRELWVRMGGEEIERLWKGLGVKASKERPLPAPADTLHAVYTDLLELLPLSDRHAKWLSKRGLDADWAFGAGYRSTPEDSIPVAQALWEKWGFRLATVPGFTGAFGQGQIRLLTRQQAVLTPCRNSDGQILALKQRLLDGGKARLRLLSTPEGGARAVTLCHCPLGVGGHLWKELWVTEGERKADVVFTRTGKVTVGVPGTSTCTTCISVLDRCLEPQGTLVVALDRDGKPQTHRAQEQLIGMGRERGFRVLVAEWEGEKGVDDALVRGVEIRTVEVGVEERAVPIVDSPPTPLLLHNEPPTPTLLKDWEICTWVEKNGPVLRSDIPLRHRPNQERLISDWIRTGRLRIKLKTDKGQVLEAVH